MSRHRYEYKHESTSFFVPSRTIADQVKAFDEFAMNRGHIPLYRTYTRSSESLSSTRTRERPGSFDSNKKRGRIPSYKSVQDLDPNETKKSPIASISPKVKDVTISDKATMFDYMNSSTEVESAITRCNQTEDTNKEGVTPPSNIITNAQLPTGNGKNVIRSSHGSLRYKGDQVREVSSEITRNDKLQKQTNASNYNTLRREDEHEPKETRSFNTPHKNAKKLSHRRKSECYLLKSGCDVSPNHRQGDVTSPVRKSKLKATEGFPNVSELSEEKISTEETPGIDEDFLSNLRHTSELSKSG